MTSDCGALLVSGGTALGLRSLAGGLDTAPLLELWPLVGLFLLVFAAIGLYPGVLLGPVEELRRATLATSATYLALGAFTFLIQGAPELSRSVFLLAWGISLVTVPAFRALARRKCGAEPWWGHGAVIIGAGATAERIVRTLRGETALALKPVAVLDDGPRPPASLEGVPIAGGTELAPAFAAGGVRYAIVVLPDGERRRVADLLDGRLRPFTNVLIVPDGLAGFSRPWVSARNVGGFAALETRHQLLEPGVAELKRALDVLVAVLMAAVLLPLGLIAAVAVKLETRGAVFFAQERMGRDGRRLRLLKFRSMREDAEQRLAELVSADAERRAEYQAFHKLQDDPRVTRVGRLLRKYSLDELPQLLHVLRGDMTLVGPRPYMPSERASMNGSEHAILSATPGVTGLWQVTGRNDVTFEDRVSMDVAYVHHWSIWLDIYLLGRTVGVVLAGRGR